MNIYTIIEKQNFNSVKKGYEYEAKTLTIAKRQAKRGKCRYGTVLVIEQNGVEVARANESGKWIA